jgi:hypothetical protein
LADEAAEEPVGSGRAQTRLGASARGRSAWRPGRSERRLRCRGRVRVSVRCPVSGASVRWPAGPVQVTGVRCGRLSVQVSSVRPSASVVSDRNEVAGVAVGPAAARLGWPGSAWSPAVSTTARRLPRLEPGPRGWHRPCWASSGSTWTWVVSWAVVGQRARTTGGRPGEAGRGRGSPVGRRLAVTTLRGHGPA